MNPAKHFIIAGAQRSGSTFLTSALSRHPEIFMARPFAPEPKYFLPGRRTAFSLAEYHKLFFETAAPSMLLGEKSVSYFETPGVPQLIHRHIPDVKLVFVLRNPVLRAVSNYYYSKSYGYETRSLEEAFSELNDRPSGPEAFGVSASPYAYLARGRYEEMLRRFEDQFGRESMHIIVLEAWLQEDIPFDSLLRFLGADPSGENKMRADLKWRESDTLGRIPLSIGKNLERYYEPYNQALSRRYGLNLTAWTQF